MNNPNITFFFVSMKSPYISKRTNINGHAIYNALLRTRMFNPKDISKVSFGISQNYPISLKGKNDFYVNIEEPDKKKTIIKNIEKGYEGFKILRLSQNNLTNPLLDYSPIPFLFVCPKHGNVITHEIQYFNFYIIWNGNVPDIKFKGFEFGIGKSRNKGFGFAVIHDYMHTNSEQIIKDSIDSFTAYSGLCGIYNHSKYGFGEFIVDKTKDDVSLIKLITPLCLNSEIIGSTSYGSLPAFIKPIEYDKINYYLYHKGIESKLECIDNGKVMEIDLSHV